MVLAGQGIAIRPVAHNDVEELERAMATMTAAHRTVWYVGEGVYSKFGDLAPLEFLATLMDEKDNLHVYLDDAHGFSWQGEKGRGFVLSQYPLEQHPVQPEACCAHVASLGELVRAGWQRPHA